MEEINRIAAKGLLFDDRYKLLRPLSSDGGTADVWLALDTNTIDEVFDDNNDQLTSLEDTGINVAIKIYRPKNALDLGEQRFREEFKIVFNCHHTNLVQPINFSIYKDIPYLVLPYCKNGSSETLQGNFVDKNELWRYISDVSAGLAYLHSFNPTIVHHDIKPANILIDDNNNFAITDFGISSHRGFNREGYDDSHSGTMAYMAPERFKDDYGSIPESDIWSFGATLYELITGKVPFGEDGGLAQLNSGKAIMPQITQPIPNDIKKLIYDCLSTDISKRPSAEYIYNCSLLKKYPIKKKTWYYTGGGLAAIAAVIAAVFIFAPSEDKKDSSVSLLSDDERYAQAMVLMESTNSENLNKGLVILDSLGNSGYVPALYQQAYTYGWYSDSTSIARKDILGIEYYPKGTDEAWLPKSQSINSKAIGLFTRIEELNDSKYPEINANALYRLAAYYLNDNKIFKTDRSRAETLLRNARIWAQQGNDSIIRRRIDNGLNELNLIKK